MLCYGFGLSSLGKFLPAGVTTYMDGVVSEKKTFPWDRQQLHSGI